MAVGYHLFFNKSLKKGAPLKNILLEAYYYVSNLGKLTFLR